MNTEKRVQGKNGTLKEKKSNKMENKMALCPNVTPVVEKTLFKN